jgi:hypothetical protein
MLPCESPGCGFSAGHWRGSRPTPQPSRTANRRVLVNTASLYEGPEDQSQCAAWVEEFASALRQGDHGAYVNFLGDEGEDRIRGATPRPPGTD